jgi:hypothetical protein
MELSAFFDHIGTDTGLVDLPPQQTEAIITLLAAVMHADRKVTVLERSEFADLVARLPFYDDKARLTAEIDAAMATNARTDDASRRALVDAVAIHVQTPAVRQTAYRMAVALSMADLEMQPEEARLLGWLATAFGLDSAFTAKVHAEFA